MHSSKFTLLITSVAYFSGTHAWPAMAGPANDLTRKLAEINRASVARRLAQTTTYRAKRYPQVDDGDDDEEEGEEDEEDEEEEEEPMHNEDDEGPNDDDGNPVLIGDLVNGATTPTGQAIASILMKTASGQSTEAGYVAPGPVESEICQQDTCCVWSYVSQVMSDAFTGPTGRCNKLARGAIRLGFHDAATWSTAGAAAGNDFGGADGSIVLSGVELSRPENNGLQAIGAKMAEWQRQFGVGMADLIQFGAIHAVVTCPLGPRLRFFVGRTDSSAPAIDGLLPDVNASADDLINLFENKTIVPHDLAALLGAHSTSQQFFVDPSRAGQPQDSTPGVWDVRYYSEVLASPSPSDVFRFHSDEFLSTHPKISSEWNSFTFNDGQNHWNEDYAQSYTRLSMLGVNTMNSMTECSKVLPLEITNFPGADVPGLDE